VSAALGAIHVSPASPAPDLADFVHETSRVTMVGFFVLNALFEELIGRAYLISETTALTGSQTVAIGASVLLAGDVSPSTKAFRTHARSALRSSYFQCTTYARDAWRLWCWLISTSMSS